MTDRGGVLLYWNDKWNTICSDDFNDTSARVVCRELGFEDGRAQCCSAYGDLLQYGHVVTHKVGKWLLMLAFYTPCLLLLALRCKIFFCHSELRLSSNFVSKYKDNYIISSKTMLFHRG